MGAPDLSFGAEHAAIRAVFGARIEITRRSVSARDVGAALRALFDEQSAAFRSLGVRRQAAKVSARERRLIDRADDREARRQARPS